MDYKQWMDLLGQPADDPAVADALAKAGVAKPSKLGGDEISITAEVPKSGINLLFHDESVLRPDTGIVGRPVLSGVLILVQHPTKPNLYTGPLPYELVKDTSRDAVRAKFGPPAEIEDDLRWDQWFMDDKGVQVAYAKGLQSIRGVSLKLKEIA